MRNDEAIPTLPDARPFPLEGAPHVTAHDCVTAADNGDPDRPDLEGVVADILRSNPLASREEILALLILFGA